VSIRSSGNSTIVASGSVISSSIQPLRVPSKPLQALRVLSSLLPTVVEDCCPSKPSFKPSGSAIVDRSILLLLLVYLNSSRLNRIVNRTALLIPLRRLTGTRSKVNSTTGRRDLVYYPNQVQVHSPSTAANTLFSSLSNTL
jgi:hypothetical protein